MKWLNKLLGAPALEPPQLRMLAMAGPLGKLNDESFTAFASRFAEPGCRHVLAEAWSAPDRPGLLAQMRWLLEAGHGLTCRAILEGQIGAEELASDYPEGKVQFTLSADYRPQLELDGLHGWDAGRLMSVARWGVGAGYLSQREAWEWMGLAADVIDANYDGWESYGKSWELGYRFWNDGGDLDATFAQALSWCRHASRSPWKTIRF